MSTDKQSGGVVLKSAVLWVLAVVIMFLAAGYQEKTGPTKEFKGTFHVDGEAIEFELVRSGTTDAEARVSVPDPNRRGSGEVFFKRYPTNDPFSPLTMEAEAGDLQAFLPVQPASGKLEYYVLIEVQATPIRIPEEGTLILRYKDPVPPGVLAPHIIFMFLALLVGVRTALGAVFLPGGVRKLAWTTLGLMTVGGMILGPVVQKYAFGAFWTGWPLGYDLTDNKTLIMWLVWVFAVLVLWKRKTPGDPWARGAVLAAAAVMMTVYLIPHSLRGSEFDYSQAEENPAVDGSPGQG